VKEARLENRGIGVAGETRVHLDGDATVDTI
jgi:hypothetical protein